MRTIDKPDDDPKEVYLTCISRVRNPALKARLESVADNVDTAAENYDQNAINGDLYTIAEHNNVAGIVSKSEMEKVYTGRMAKVKAPGRPIYDKLKESAHQGICPFCGQRNVSQLDHYLPKANFPVLNVVPCNLVPSCSDCNKAKLSDVPDSEGEQTFHPYYDDVTAEQWLYAEVVVVDSAPKIRFFVDAPDDWDAVLQARAQIHFTTFELCDLYTSQAGTELSNIRFQLERLFNQAGINAVRDHLNELADSRYDNHVNSWQTAMYQALADSVWFCDRGFLNV